MQRRQMWLLVLGGVAAAAVLPSAQGQPGAATATTLLSVKRPIGGFAQDGGWMVWSQGGRCGKRVQARRISGGPTYRLTAPDGPVCADSFAEYGPGRMALAGKRALWAYGLSSISEANFSVYTGAAGQRRERLVANLSEDAEKFSGLPMAGDGRHLVYANREEWSPTSIGVFRVVDGGLILMRLRGTGQASGLTVALALDRDRVALARVSMRTDPPPASWPIEIRSLPSGARVSSFDAGELPKAVAFSGSRVALLFGGEDDSAYRVDVRTIGGSLLSSFAVPRPAYDEISMSGRWLVFHTEGTVRAFDVSTGDERVLLSATGTVVGLSIEGRRVAWAEQISRRQSYVRALTLPR